MKYKSNGKEYELKTWHFILAGILLLYSVGKVLQKKDANSTKVFDQRDRKEIYYYDENGDVKQRETIYYDGRPTEYKYY